MLRKVAHLLTAAWLMSAALSAVARPLAEPEWCSQELAGPAGTFRVDPPAVATGALDDDVPYQELIRSVSEQHGVPAELVASLIRLESNFNPHAVSPRGARGLMQLMPDTAAQLGVRNIFDVEQNVEGGVRYLRELLELFAGDVALAVAAYNAGAEVVKRYGGIPPYPETQRYVERILSVYRRPGDRSAPGKGSGGHDPVVTPGGDLGCRPLGPTIGRWHESS